MFTESFQSIVIATQRLFRNWRALIVMAVLYAGLLASLYLFVTIREATKSQVAVTLLLAILAPLLFFLIQTTSACQADGVSPARLLKESLRNFWKVLTVTLPLIALAVLVLYVLSRAQNYIGATTPDLSNLPQHQIGAPNAGSRTTPWSVTMVTSIRYLFIGLVMPILAIHFWIAATKEGLFSVITRFKQILIRALAPGSVLIYVTGLLVCGVIPYLILFKATPSNRPWLEMGLFVGRLTIVFAMTLFGWVVTMAAMAESAERRETGIEAL